MTDPVDEILEAVRSRGLAIRPGGDGHTILLRGDRRNVTDGLKAAIAAYRDELLARLAADADRPPPQPVKAPAPPPPAPVEAPAPPPEPPGRPASDPAVRSRVVDADTGEVWWESREAFGVYRDSKRVIAALGAAGCGRRFAIERRDPFSDQCEWYELWSEQHGTAGVGRPGDGLGQPSVPAAADGGGADGSLWGPARAGVVPVAGHRA